MLVECEAFLVCNAHKMFKEKWKCIQDVRNIVNQICCCRASMFSSKGEEYIKYLEVICDEF